MEVELLHLVEVIHLILMQEQMLLDKQQIFLVVQNFIYQIIQVLNIKV
jgi:hypothetical protein